jgi:NAD(P)-dependent dehydrogenase (short-subunit alcohol dehydrogenase family)
MSAFCDQVVLLTGANGGLGEIVTRQFIDDGAYVVAVDKHWPNPPGSQRILPVNLDLLDPQQCRRAVNLTLEKHQRIDMLVHLVGSYGGGQPVAETSDETWYGMFDSNLHATFNLCREVLPHMLRQGRGRIIATGSKAGVNPQRNYGAYHVSKAAMHALMRVMALECRGTGVTVNAILPNTIDTPGNRCAMPDADTTKWVKPNSIAQLILYLASEAASEINGSLIPVNGKS